LQYFPSTGSIGHKRRTIEICRKSPNIARQGPIPSKHEHGQARWEEGLGSAMSGRVDQGQGHRHRRGTTTKDDQPKKPEGQPMLEE
jgi:hypothetical protein